MGRVCCWDSPRSVHCPVTQQNFLPTNNSFSFSSLLHTLLSQEINIHSRTTTFFPQPATLPTNLSSPKVGKSPFISASFPSCHHIPLIYGRYNDISRLHLPALPLFRNHFFLLHPLILAPHLSPHHVFLLCPLPLSTAPTLSASPPFRSLRFFLHLVGVSTEREFHSPHCVLFPPVISSSLIWLAHSRLCHPIHTSPPLRSRSSLSLKDLVEACCCLPSHQPSPGSAIVVKPHRCFYQQLRWVFNNRCLQRSLVFITCMSLQAELIPPFAVVNYTFPSLKTH